MTITVITVQTTSDHDTHIKKCQLEEHHTFKEIPYKEKLHAHTNTHPWEGATSTNDDLRRGFKY